MLQTIKYYSLPVVLGLVSGIISRFAFSSSYDLILDDYFDVWPGVIFGIFSALYLLRNFNVSRLWRLLVWVVLCPVVYFGAVWMTVGFAMLDIGVDSAIALYSPAAVLGSVVLVLLLRLIISGTLGRRSMFALSLLPALLMIPAVLLELRLEGAGINSSDGVFSIFAPWQIGMMIVIAAYIRPQRGVTA